jgi:hypothetical protein
MISTGGPIFFSLESNLRLACLGVTPWLRDGSGKLMKSLKSSQESEPLGLHKKGK